MTDVESLATYDEVCARADAIDAGTVQAVAYGPGKFEGCADAIVAESLYGFSLDTSYLDEEQGSIDEDGYYLARIGRFLIEEDDRGFFDYRDFGTEDAARDYFASA